MSWPSSTADLRRVMPRRTRCLGLLASRWSAWGWPHPGPGVTDGACADPAHRFESFALPALEFGPAKRILVYLPPGHDCAPHRGGHRR
jgi:hypothetical protein